MGKYRERSALKRRLIARFFSAIDREFTASAPQQVLDVGCGDGVVLEYLRTRHPSVLFAGLDRAEELLAHLQSRLPDVRLYHEDILERSQITERYDLVLALEILEHIEDPQRALASILNLSARSIIVSVPWEPAFALANLLRGKNIRRFGNDPEHINHWTKQGIQRLIARQARIVRTTLSFPWTIVRAEKQ